MAFRPLENAAIREILDNAGPAFLRTICIEPLFMADLVKAKVLLSHQSQTVQKTDPDQRCNALLSHLYTVSPQQFVDFCLVLCDEHNKQEFVTEGFGLDIGNLRAQQGSHPQIASSRKIGVKFDIKISVSGSEDREEIYSEFVSVMRSDDKETTELINTLKGKCRDIISTHFGSAVLKMYCPTLESLQDLQNLCTSGRLADLAANVFRNHPAFERFNLQQVNVSVTMDDNEYAQCEAELRQQGEDVNRYPQVTEHEPPSETRTTVINDPSQESSKSYPPAQLETEFHSSNEEMQYLTIGGVWAVGMRHYGKHSLKVGARYVVKHDTANKYHDNAMEIDDDDVCKAYIIREQADELIRLITENIATGEIVLKPQGEARGPQQLCNIGCRVADERADAAKAALHSAGYKFTISTEEKL